MTIILPTLDNNIQRSKDTYNRLPNFSAEALKSPYEHVDKFLNVNDSIHELPDRERVFLRLLPNTLKGKAKQWLNMILH